MRSGGLILGATAVLLASGCAATFTNRDLLRREAGAERCERVRLEGRVTPGEWPLAWVEVDDVQECATETTSTWQVRKQRTSPAAGIIAGVLVAGAAFTPMAAYAASSPRGPGDPGLGEVLIYVGGWSALGLGVGTGLAATFIRWNAGESQEVTVAREARDSRTRILAEQVDITRYRGADGVEWQTVSPDWLRAACEGAGPSAQILPTSCSKAGFLPSSRLTSTQPAPMNRVQRTSRHPR